MKKTRRKFDSAFKTTVVLEALKERQTLSELAVKYELHPNQISQWKQEFLEKSSSVFEGSSPSALKEDDEDTLELYAKIGRLEMERDFLKKSLRKLGLL